MKQFILSSLTFIFYAIAILPILWELGTLQTPKVVYDFIDKMQSTPVNNRTENQKNLFYLMCFYHIWIMMGLFSSQWILFLIIMGLSVIPKKNTYIQVIDALITFFLLMFIILNKYHFHINMYNIIKSYLSC